MHLLSGEVETDHSLNFNTNNWNAVLWHIPLLLYVYITFNLLIFLFYELIDYFIY